MYSAVPTYHAAIPWPTFWAKNWHTGYFSSGQRLLQFWFFWDFWLSNYEPVRTDGQTDGQDDRTTKIACITASATVQNKRHHHHHHHHHHQQQQQQQRCVVVLRCTVYSVYSVVIVCCCCCCCCLQSTETNTTTCSPYNVVGDASSSVA